MKLKYHEVHDDIYHRNFHLIVNESRESLLSWLVNFHKITSEKEKELKEFLGGAKGVWIHEYKPYYYLWIEKFNWTIEDYGVLAHEIRHLVDWVICESGIRLDYENTEVTAFYTEYIFKKCLSALQGSYETKVHKSVKKRSRYT